MNFRSSVQADGLVLFCVFLGLAVSASAQSTAQAVGPLHSPVSQPKVFASFTAVVGDPEIARLFVLGVGMRTHTGVARAMFGALARRGINISMINTSEVRVSVVVDGRQGEAALAALKEAFPG